MALCTRDFKKILDIIEIIYAIPDRASMFREVCEEVQKLIPFPSAVLFARDPQSCNYLLQDSHLYNAQISGLVSFCLYYAPLSPFHQVHLLFEKKNISSVRITDLISPTRLCETEYCRDFLAPLHIFYILSMQFKSSRGIFSSIALHRSRSDRDFTDREQEIINILIPHFSTSFKNIDSIQQGVVTDDGLMSKLVSFDLSRRQQDVAFLVMQGFSNREIGRRLFIAEQTVKDHVSDIFKKLRIRRRAELSAKVMGIITSD
jgi:DNA-binding CsgD family transcriptional regulator